MLAKHLEKKETEGGFTLVELLVVILIIGILAAVAIPAFLGQRQRANDASVESDVKNLATQVESALIANPNTDTFSLVAGTGNSVDVTVGSETFNFKHSDGVTLTVAPKTATTETGDYVITGLHSNGKEHITGSVLTYDSALGGLQP